MDHNDESAAYHHTKKPCSSLYAGHTVIFLSKWRSRNEPVSTLVCVLGWGGLGEVAAEFASEGCGEIRALL